MFERFLQSEKAHAPIIVTLFGIVIFSRLFTSKAIDLIAKESAGIPRMVNRICEKSLMYAYQQHHKLIDDYAVALIVENEIAN